MLFIQTKNGVFQRHKHWVLTKDGKEKCRNSFFFAENAAHSVVVSLCSWINYAYMYAQRAIDLIDNFHPRKKMERFSLGTHAILFFSPNKCISSGSILKSQTLYSRKNEIIQMYWRVKCTEPSFSSIGIGEKFVNCCNVGKIKSWEYCWGPIIKLSMSPLLSFHLGSKTLHFWWLWFFTVHACFQKITVKKRGTLF